MLRRLGPKQEAQEAYGAALELIGNGPERCFAGCTSHVLTQTAGASLDGVSALRQRRRDEGWGH
jgi:hypothetical protein